MSRIRNCGPYCTNKACVVDPSVLSRYESDASNHSVFRIGPIKEVPDLNGFGFEFATTHKAALLFPDWCASVKATKAWGGLPIAERYGNRAFLDMWHGKQVTTMYRTVNVGARLP
jgi:hypothetical protein